MWRGRREHAQNIFISKRRAEGGTFAICRRHFFRPPSSLSPPLGTHLPVCGRSVACCCCAANPFIPTIASQSSSNQTTAKKAHLTGRRMPLPPSTLLRAFAQFISQPNNANRFPPIHPVIHSSSQMSHHLCANTIFLPFTPASSNFPDATNYLRYKGVKQQLFHALFSFFLIYISFFYF